MTDTPAPLILQNDKTGQAAASATSDQTSATSSPCEATSRTALSVEAALLTTDRPISTTKLATALEACSAEKACSASEISQAIDALNALYEKTSRSFRIAKLAGGWQIVTQPAYAQVLSALHKTRTRQKLSAAALETLAIIAYRQPILRANIESIRGVASGEVIRSLMEHHLVKIVGRAEEIGRPMLYGTTRSFLELFGLSSLKDLPKASELRPIKPKPPKKPPSASTSNSDSASATDSDSASGSDSSSAFGSGSASGFGSKSELAPTPASTSTLKSSSDQDSGQENAPSGDSSALPSADVQTDIPPSAKAQTQEPPTDDTPQTPPQEA